jgi:hypothetical protein
LADVAATPESRLPAGAGLGTRFHAVPFQWTISVPLPLLPTAQALSAEVAATAERLPLTVKAAAGTSDPVRTAAAAGMTEATPPVSKSNAVSITRRTANCGARTGPPPPPRTAFRLNQSRNEDKLPDGIDVEANVAQEPLTAQG